VCTQPCSHACTFACTFACTAACTFACTHACTGACTHFCTVICTQMCTICSEITCTGCSHKPTTCHPVSILPPQEGEAALSSLAALKDQLKQQIAAVEEQEKAIDATLQPQTVSQVDQLLAKLQDAMEDLKKQRVTLAQKEEQEKKQKNNP